MILDTDAHIQLLESLHDYTHDALADLMDLWVERIEDCEHALEPAEALHHFMIELDADGGGNGEEDELGEVGEEVVAVADHDLVKELGLALFGLEPLWRESVGVGGSWARGTCLNGAVFVALVLEEVLDLLRLSLVGCFLDRWRTHSFGLCGGCLRLRLSIEFLLGLQGLLLEVGLRLADGRDGLRKVLDLLHQGIDLL